ncbi:MAG TPA: hypothetical protein PKB13_02695 [Clostridia bacterium]|nr:hypothetical protein [Clostridia bacterium]
MAKFQFRDYSHEIEFPECKFRVNCNSDIGDLMKEKHEKFLELLADYKAGKKTKQDAIDYIMKTIDEILGGGAALKILAGRPVTLSDLSDILVFTSNEITAHVKKMVREDSGSTVSMNREQRRAAGNK